MWWRGSNPLDDGEDLAAHRALARAFARGRDDTQDLARHFHNWTDGELAALRAARERGTTVAAIARALRRTPSAVATKITELDLACDTSWTDDEDRVVVAGVGRGLTNREIAPMLPGRSHLAVKQRARILLGPRGAELWTEAEKAALRRAVDNGDNLRAFARAIGRGISAVQWQRRALGLSHPNAVVPYTAAEDRRIVEGWKRRERPAEIAADLDRPVAGIYNRAFKLGITGHGKGRYHGPRVRRFEIEYVRAAQGWTGRQIAEKLRRSYHMVYQIARKNGIRFPKRGRRRAAAN